MTAAPIRFHRDSAGSPFSGWPTTGIACPRAGGRHGGVFIPMYQREALWLSFEAPYWRPSAAKVAFGKVNAISGGPWCERLNAEEQDYVVCPDQPWLDGINAGDGFIRQFVAMPLGMGYTVEGQIAGKEEFGGIQIIAFEPKPGRFEDPSHAISSRFTVDLLDCNVAFGAEMGLGAGGRMEQKIYPDEYGVDTWDQDRFGRVYVHIVNSMMFREITGMEPPRDTARTYSQYGLPWFELYDEHKGDAKPSGVLSGVRTVKEVDSGNGFEPQQDDTPVETDGQIVTVDPDPGAVKDGKW
jgi:hypothetical protein